MKIYKTKIILTILIITLSISGFAQISNRGLIAWYPFSGNALDLSGNGFNGEVFGVVSTSDRFGNRNSALSFNGDDSYIDLSIFIDSLNVSEPATISFWVKSELDAPQAIFSISDSTQSVYGISVLYIGNFTTSTLADELICCANRTNLTDDYITGYTTTNRSILLDNKWHHLVYIFDGELTRIFLDNNQLPLTDYKSNNGHFGNIANANKMLIGSRYSNGMGAFFNGSLDELRIYNRVLNINEISNLFYESKTYFESVEDIESLVIAADTLESDSEPTISAIRIYPNNEKDQLYIDSDERYFGYKIKIINTLDKVIFKKTINQAMYLINLDSWSGAGNYFVQIFDSKGNLIDVKKIVLNHILDSH